MFSRRQKLDLFIPFRYAATGPYLERRVTCDFQNIIEVQCGPGSSVGIATG